MKPELLHSQGNTRSDRCLTHLLQTPDTFVRTPLPGAAGSEFAIHAAPALGAAFTWMTVYSVVDGALHVSTAQRFLYVLEGEYEVDHAGGSTLLRAGSYAYLPQGYLHTVRATMSASAVLIEKPYISTTESAPELPLFGHESAVTAVPLMGDEALLVRGLMPNEPRYDFAVNTMTYDPGASLSIVEVHVMEHGLLMLEGAGIYKLGDRWYPVAAGDFIWMAPYCPQWFCAVGKQPAKYLIYKDWNRHPLS